MLIIFITFSIANCEFLSPTTLSVPSNAALTQAVGENCGYTNIYDIYGVDVNPWPPTPGMVGVLTMIGKFVKGTYVQEIVLGTCYNSMLWNYDPVDVDKSWPTGEEVQFDMVVVFPNEHGSYISNVQLTAGDHICCWQFSYNIS